MNNPSAVSLLAGAFAGLAYSGIAAGVAGGIFVVYLPVLPLLWAGLSGGMRSIGTAVLVALIVTGVLLGGPDMLMFLLFLAVPSTLLTLCALLRRGENKTEASWYPLTGAMAWMALYGAGLFLLLAWHYSGEEGGLQGKMIREMKGAFETMEPKMAEAMTRLVEGQTYLLVSSTVWLWLLMVYVMALVAHLLLSARSLRPDFTFSASMLPTWTLAALIGSAALSLAGGAWSFIGTSLFAIFLLPYFLSGMAWVHARSLSWNNRSFLLLGIYLCMVLMIWPAAAIAAIGVFRHMRGLHDFYSHTNT